MKRIIFTCLLACCLTFMIQAQNYRTLPDFGGTLSVLSTYPFDLNYGYTRTAVIYNKADIGGSGNIIRIAYVTTTAFPDSIPVVVKFKYSATAAWGGTGTYAALSTGATTVFQGKVKFASGVNYIDLQTPFNYTFNVNHLIIFTECNYGGTGSASPLSFVCKNIDSDVSYLSHFWGADNTPPSSNGQLIDYQPLVILYFDSPTQPFSISGSTDCNGNNLSWQQNVANDKVLVVAKAGTNTFSPLCFTNYAAGDSVGNGAVVVYSGSVATAALHGPLDPGTVNNYKAWSYTTSLVYSENNITTSVLSAYNAPHTADFDGGSGLPNGWSGSMVIVQDHGNVDQGLVAELQPPSVEKNVSTPVFCSIGANTILEFDYRIVDISGYPSTATPVSQFDTIRVSVSTDNGHNYTPVYYIIPSNHTSSTAFASLQIPLGAYAGDGVKIQFRCKRGSGSYYVDIDNFSIYDYSGIASSNSYENMLYPNPANDMLTVDLSAISGEVPRITLFSITGQMMMNQMAEGNGITVLNLEDLPSGMYSVLIRSNSIQLVKKFVKL